MGRHPGVMALESRLIRGTVDCRRQGVIRRLATETPTWGEKRVAEELFRLQIRPSPRMDRQFSQEKIPGPFLSLNAMSGYRKLSTANDLCGSLPGRSLSEEFLPGPSFSKRFEGQRSRVVVSNGSLISVRSHRSQSLLTGYLGASFVARCEKDAWSAPFLFASLISCRGDRFELIGPRRRTCFRGTTTNYSAAIVASFLR